MQLIRLEILNFKGIKDLTIKFKGKSTHIHGDNATGKTSIFDAVTWLLFGKDSLDRADFEIKTLENGVPIHNVNHEVTGVFTLEEGGTIELKRSFREKYSSPRGGEVKLTGHTTDYFVDDVPKKEKEYKEFVNSLVSEDIFKLITNPLYFNEQYSWQNRRKLLLDMCGDVDDSTVINSREDLRKLASILGGHTVDDHRKVVAAKKAAINKELDMIPVRIDEAIRNKPELSDSREQLETQIATLTRAINELEEEKALVKNDFSLAERESNMRDIKRRMQAREDELNSEYRANVVEIQKGLDAITNQKKIISVKEADLKVARQDVEFNIENTAKRIETLRNDFDVVNARAFNPELCPTCGQSLPADKQQELEEAFNVKKSKDLQDIQSLLDSQKRILQSYEEQIFTLGEKRTAIDLQIAEMDSEYKKLKGEEAQLQKPILEDDAAYKEIQGELFMLELEGDESDSLKLAKIDGDIAEIKAKRNRIEEELNKYSLINAIDKRVAELEDEQQHLVNEKNQLDEASFLMDEFVKAKVDMLEEKINEHFKLARFKMFDVRINGNVEECCETLFDGVPYRSMNNAARINVGLDIINALTRFYKVDAPVFVDNAEAVTEFTPINSQVIYLTVDENFKELTII